MTTTTVPTSTTTFVHRVYIKTTPEAIWQALTDPEWTNRYGYTGFVHYDELAPGGHLSVVPNEEFRAQAEAFGGALPESIIEGVVLEADPPHLLKQTWRMLMDPSLSSEEMTTLTYEIKQLEAGYCSLTVIHDCEGAPVHLALISGQQEDGGGGGGHAWVLSDLKTLLETGSPMAG